MTREQLHATINTKGNSELMIAIDAVIKDFESRTCSNCTQYQPTIYNGCKVLSIPWNYFGITPGDFCCNQWQQKD